MRTLSLKGIILGGITDIIATNIAAVPVIVVATAHASISTLPKVERAAAVVAAIQASPGLQVITLVLGALCSVLGGYVAARLAKRGELLNGALSAYFCVGIGIYSMVAGHVSVPLWQHVAGFVASPALGALGGYLRLRQTSGREEPPSAVPAAGEAVAHVPEL